MAQNISAVYRFDEDQLVIKVEGEICHAGMLRWLARSILVLKSHWQSGQGMMAGYGGLLALECLESLSTPLSCSGSIGHLNIVYHIDQHLQRVSTD